MSVAVGRQHLEDPVRHVQNRDVERAAPQVEHRDLLVLLLFQPVCQGRRGRLIDDPRHLQSRDLPRVLRRLPLAVVKVSRHRDHGFPDLVPEIALGRLLQLAQNHPRDLGRRVVLLARVHLHELVRPAQNLVGDHRLLVLHLIMTPPHEPLDRVDRFRGVRDRLPLGRIAHQRVTLGRERHHRRRQSTAVLIRNDRDVSTLHHRDHAVRRPQIDPNYLFTFRHDASPFPGCALTRPTGLDFHLAVEATLAYRHADLADHTIRFSTIPNFIAVFSLPPGVMLDSIPLASTMPQQNTHRIKRCNPNECNRVNNYTHSLRSRHREST